MAKEDDALRSETFFLGTRDLAEEMTATFLDKESGRRWARRQGWDWVDAWGDLDPSMSDWLYHRNSGWWSPVDDGAWWIVMESLRAAVTDLIVAEPDTLMAVGAWLGNRGDLIGQVVMSRLWKLDSRVRSDRDWYEEARHVHGL